MILVFWLLMSNCTPNRFTPTFDDRLSQYMWSAQVTVRGIYL